MKKRIVLIEPKTPNIHIFTQFKLPRLGVFVLGNLMKKRGWDVSVIIEEHGGIDFDRVKNADLVGISTITPTAPRSYAIADVLRRNGTTVVMGGPHVTFLPEEALEHSDFVVRGEGEIPLEKLADYLEGKCELSDVPSLSYRIEGKTFHNEICEMIKDCDTIPYPDFSLVEGGFRVKSAGRYVIPVQTSRGCPFDCSFCSVTGMFGKKYRFRSTENIIRELRQYDDRKNFIFFYDDNFTHSKRRANELLDAMLAEKFKFLWSTQARVDVARDPVLLKKMKKAGCHTLFIGFESVNPKSLGEMKKGQSVEDIRKAIKEIRKVGIHIHGMFVYGFEEDNWETVEGTVDFIKKSGLTSVQLLILTPLPGSEFYDRMSKNDRIVLKDWALYDTHHAVFQPKGFSIPELQKAQIYSHAKIYSHWENLKKLFSVKLVDFSLGFYARHINTSWQKKNMDFMKAISMDNMNNPDIDTDYREKIEIVI